MKEELMKLMEDLSLEVKNGVLTSDEAAQLLTYGNIVED